MSKLLDVPVPTKIKLSALWAATMSCYIYCDYFQLYVPGKLADIQAGKMGPLGAVTQGVLLGTAVLMAIPSLMIFLSVALPAPQNRPLNLIAGALYAILLALILFTTSWNFYRFFAAIEVALSALVVWISWKWPRADTALS